MPCLGHGVVVGGLTVLIQRTDRIGTVGKPQIDSAAGGGRRPLPAHQLVPGADHIALVVQVPRQQEDVPLPAAVGALRPRGGDHSLKTVGLGDALAPGENIIAPVPGLVLLGEDTPTEIIILGKVRAGILAHAVAGGIVRIFGRAAVHLADAACAIERVLVESVIQQVSGSVISIADQPVVAGGNILMLRRKAGCQALLQEIAPRVIRKA
jgi:hypothetical protein